MSHVEPLRIRRHPEALVQRPAPGQPLWGTGLAIDVRQLPACRDFVFKHYTTSRKGGRQGTSRQADTAALQAAASEYMSREQALDNVRAWIAADAVLYALEARHGRGDPSLWCATLAYLFETQGLLEGDERGRAAAKWDIQDVVDDVHELAQQAGFQMKYPLNAQLTRNKPDDRIPRPTLPPTPITALPGPVTRRHSPDS